MSASGGTRAIIVSVAANVIVAVAKLAAWLFTGSAALLATGVNSLADATSQSLLLRGERLTSRESNRGDAKRHTAFGIAASIVLFTAAGVIAIVQGVAALGRAGADALTWSFTPVALAVLVIALVVQSAALYVTRNARTASRAAGQSWGSFVGSAEAPALPIVHLQHMFSLFGVAASLAGLGLTMLTSETIFDALGSLAVGALMLLNALLLTTAVRGLGSNTAASQADTDAVMAAFTGMDAVAQLRQVTVLPQNAGELLVAAKVSLVSDRSLSEAAADLAEIAEHVRAAVSKATTIYIEPDVYRPVRDTPPPTDVFVLRSAD